MKYSPRFHKLKTPKKPLDLSKRKILRAFLIVISPFVLIWIFFFSNLLKVQSTEFNLPPDFNCLTNQDLRRYDQDNQSVFLFDTQTLEEKIEQNSCIQNAFVELTPNRKIVISLTQTRPVANFYINPKLDDVEKVASSSVDLRTSTVSALLQSSSLIDTSKDLNSRSLIEPRTSSVSSLPKFVVSEKIKAQSDFANYKINEVLDCLSQNLIQTSSVVLVNQLLILYYISVNNGFTTLDAKLLINPSAVSKNFCTALQEIIQKSTIDGIKLDSIDLRFKDPVVNLKK